MYIAEVSNKMFLRKDVVSFYVLIYYHCVVSLPGSGMVTPPIST